MRNFSYLCSALILATSMTFSCKSTSSNRDSEEKGSLKMDRHHTISGYEYLKDFRIIPFSIEHLSSENCVLSAASSTGEMIFFMDSPCSKFYDVATHRPVRSVIESSVVFYLFADKGGSMVLNGKVVGNISWGASRDHLKSFELCSGPYDYVCNMTLTHTGQFCTIEGRGIGPFAYPGTCGMFNQ